MELKHIVGNYGHFVIKEPIKNFYLKSNDPSFVPETDSVILYMGGNLISRTDKLTKIINNGEEFYRVDFFKNDLILPMNLIYYYDIELQRKVNYLENEIMGKKIVRVKEIYYEIDDKYATQQSEIIKIGGQSPHCSTKLNVDNDGKSTNGKDNSETLNQAIACPIVYMNPLLNYTCSEETMRKYGLDENWHNRLIIIDGLCGLQFSR